MPREVSAAGPIRWGGLCDSPGGCVKPSARAMLSLRRAFCRSLLLEFTRNHFLHNVRNNSPNASWSFSCCWVYDQGDHDSRGCFFTPTIRAWRFVTPSHSVGVSLKQKARLKLALGALFLFCHAHLYDTNVLIGAHVTTSFFFFFKPKNRRKAVFISQNIYIYILGVFVFCKYSLYMHVFFCVCIFPRPWACSLEINSIFSGEVCFAYSRTTLYYLVL